MTQRLNNITTRGIVLYKGQSLRYMYDQRIPLYETYADIRIDSYDEDFEIILERIVDEIHEILTNNNQDFRITPPKWSKKSAMDAFKHAMKDLIVMKGDKDQPKE